MHLTQDVRPNSVGRAYDDRDSRIVKQFRRIMERAGKHAGVTGVSRQSASAAKSYLLGLLDEYARPSRYTTGGHFHLDSGSHGRRRRAAY